MIILNGMNWTRHLKPQQVETSCGDALEILRRGPVPLRIDETAAAIQQLFQEHQSAAVGFQDVRNATGGGRMERPAAPGEDLVTVRCHSADGRHQIGDEDHVTGPAVAIGQIPRAAHADVGLRVPREFIGWVPGRYPAAAGAHQQEIVAGLHLSDAPTSYSN